MAAAVRVMTVERGIDPRELTLIAFGGAGPMHGAAVAEELGMKRVVVPPASEVLSAVGMVVSERRVDLVESVLLSEASFTHEAVVETIERLAADARTQLNTDDAEVRPAFDVRYAGQAFELTVRSEPEPQAIRSAFEHAHADRYGFTDHHADVELVTVRVSLAQPGSPMPPAEGTFEPSLVVPDGWTASLDSNYAWVLERDE
jgi:N-methylhydantoinase A